MRSGIVRNEVGDAVEAEDGDFEVSFISSNIIHGAVDFSSAHLMAAMIITIREDADHIVHADLHSAGTTVYITDLDISAGVQGMDSLDINHIISADTTMGTVALNRGRGDAAGSEKK